MKKRKKNARLLFKDARLKIATDLILIEINMSLSP